MDNVITFPRAARSSGTGAVSIANHERAMLLFLVRASSCILMRPRDALYAELLARERVDDLGKIDRHALPALVNYLHQLMQSRLMIGQQS